MHDDQKIEISKALTLAEFLGRVKTEIEFIAPTVGLFPLEVATRIAAVLNGAEIWTLLGLPHRMRDVRVQTPKALKRLGRQVEEPMGTLEANPRQVARKKRLSGVNNWFNKLSEEEKQAVIEKRKKSYAKTRKAKENGQRTA
jgi:hypothetical protein